MSHGLLLGVLGGMGPLASAEFVRTIYELNRFLREQEAPACVLYSDPSFPDRSLAIGTPNDTELVESLTVAVDRLLSMGADRIVLACMTGHYYLPRLSPVVSAAVVSLVDVVYEELRANPKKSLFLCTSGTRAGRIFESHSAWPTLERFIVFPDPADQQKIHDVIYRLKVGAPKERFRHVREIKRLAAKYEVDVVVAACTEFHLLWRELERATPPGFLIDPLLVIARRVGSLMKYSDDVVDPVAAPARLSYTAALRAPALGNK